MSAMDLVRLYAVAADGRRAGSTLTGRGWADAAMASSELGYLDDEVGGAVRLIVMPSQGDGEDWTIDNGEVVKVESVVRRDF